MVKVVNLKNEKYTVYIGRRFKRGKYNFEESLFHNPYTLKEFNGDRKLCLDAFYKYFYKRIQTDKDFKQDVLELRHEILGGWCKPLDCHGNTIKNYIDMYFADKEDTF